MDNITTNELRKEDSLYRPETSTIEDVFLVLSVILMFLHVFSIPFGIILGEKWDAVLSIFVPLYGFFVTVFYFLF